MNTQIDNEAQHFSVTFIENREIEASGEPKPFSKYYWLGDDGELRPNKNDNAAKACVRRAKATVETFGTLQAFMDRSAGLPSHVAMVHGVPMNGLMSARIIMKDEKTHERFADQDDVIARCERDFAWPDGPVLMQLDYDPEDGKPALAADEWLAIVLQVCPELAGVQIGVASSVSSHLYDSDGRQLKGDSGKRFYVVLDDSTQIERVAASLGIRLFEAGYGFVKYGAIAAYPRTLIDMSVFRASHPNFVGRASLGEGLIQRRPKPFVTDGAPMLRVADVPDMGGFESYRAKSDVIRRLLGKPEVTTRAKQRREKWAARKAEKTGLPAAVWLRHCQHRTWPGDAPILLNDGRETTFKQIAEDPGEYADCYCADPMEPGEGRSRAVIRVNERGAVRIHSFLHGGPKGAD